jgi:hypothetical protein
MTEAPFRPVPTPSDLAAFARRPAPPAAPAPTAAGRPADAPPYDRGAWEHAVLSSGLHANARLVALALAHHAGTSGYLAPGWVQDARSLTRDTGLRGRFVRLSMTQLEQDGYLTRPSVLEWDEPRPRPVTLTVPPANGPRREEPPSTGEPR